MATTAAGAHDTFDRSPQRAARVYGVDYSVFDQPDGGTLYVTQRGRPALDYLHPSQWFDGQRFARDGDRLAPTVYRLQVQAPGRRPLPLVIKFSRFATEVPLEVHSTFDGLIQQQDIDQARFLDPFQEFGRLHDLRRGRFGPPGLRICTKRPLAIYRAPDAEPAWRLGRKGSEFARAQHAISADQADSPAPVALEDDHVYVLLYHWVDGLNLLEALDARLITIEELTALTREVAGDLSAKGFLVLDHKPHHIIVRPAGDGLLRRHGRPAYAIIDFELLERTDAYCSYLASTRSNRIGEAAKSPVPL